MRESGEVLSWGGGGGGESKEEGKEKDGPFYIWTKIPSCFFLCNLPLKNPSATLIHY